MVASARGRNWCFTDFNVTDERRELYVDAYDDGELKYLIIGREVCPESSREHFQGFLVAKNTITAPKLHRLFPGAHITLCNGTAEQNNIYCSKDGDFEEWGEMPMSRARKARNEKEKWLAVISSAEKGKCDEEFPGEWIRYNTTLKRMFKPVYPAFSPYSGIWICGPTGVGKSRYAREKFPDPFLKLKNKWWDNYQFQENVLIDDITPDHSQLAHHLLLWVDHYAFPAEYKGGATEYRPKNIVVTSNYTIDEVFYDQKAPTIASLKRRFEVVEVKEGDDVMAKLDALECDVHSQPSESSIGRRVFDAMYQCRYPNCDCEGDCDHSDDSGCEIGNIDVPGLIEADQNEFDNLLSEIQEDMRE